MIRPSPPRFLNFGDKCHVSVILQNQTDSAQQVFVAGRVTNLKFQGKFSGGLTTNIPPLSRAAFLFPVETHKAGIGRLQCKKKKKIFLSKKKKIFFFPVVGACGDFSDAAEVKFPIYTPSSSEAFASIKKKIFFF